MITLFDVIYYPNVYCKILLKSDEICIENCLVCLQIRHIIVCIGRITYKYVGLHVDEVVCSCISKESHCVKLCLCSVSLRYLRNQIGFNNADMKNDHHKYKKKDGWRVICKKLLVNCFRGFYKEERNIRTEIRLHKRDKSCSNNCLFIR